MPRKKTKEQGSLGKTLIRNRFRGQRTVNNERSLNHTSDLDDGADWARLGGVSITEQNALDEFLATAELAGTEFTAQRLNVKLVTGLQNEALPSREKQLATAQAQSANRKRLRVPRRPEWTRDMPKEELHLKERESFLEWRRGLAQLEEMENIVMTPFERNLDFWRQFWRVVERSDVVVQIVDARNPLLFRCPDIEEYVREISASKINLLLINKADLLTDEQRNEWAQYLTKAKIDFVFFSAAVEAHKSELKGEWYMRGPYLEMARQQREERARQEEEEERRRLAEEQDDDDEGDDDGDDDGGDDGGDDKDEEEKEGAEVKEEQQAGTEKGAVAVVETLAEDKSATEEEKPADETLEAEATATDDSNTDASTTHASPSSSSAPQHSSRELFDVDRLLQLLRSLGRKAAPHKAMPTVGMVGYPNVGKSSTINAICRDKMVSVSATPGKTKHFQTISLGDLELCDCPGLVFPNFANTKAELVCNGVLPIDQLRDVVPATTYLTHHIPRDVLERTYGIMIIRPGEDEDPSRPPTAFEFLNAFSYARGFMNPRGLPDTSRGARIVLKDFVKGKLLYCHPPPGYKSSPGTTTFLTSETSRPTKAREMDAAAVVGPKHRPTYANEVDDQFFRQADVKAVIKGVRTSSSNQPMPTGKKHHKKNKREKLRRLAKKP